jgi:alkylated DNA nucleotide flippase Atl1
VWLTEMGLDITLQQVQAYRVAGAQLIVSVSRVFPIADVEEFTISPMRAEAKAAAERRTGSRERSTVVRLAAARTIPDGTRLTLRTTNEISADVRAMIDSWVDEDPRRGRATWRNDAAKPLVWDFDGEGYRPSAIIQQALSDLGMPRRPLRGPRWWTLPDGRDLPTVAGESGGGGFDWSPLHAVLAALPAGRWTTYGELAEVVGTAAMPVGQHISACPECPNAYRVLGSDGKPREGFKWGDASETRSQQQWLEEEGVVFSGDRAVDAHKLRAPDLRGLVSNG